VLPNIHHHHHHIIMWLVRCWTLPFLRACSRLDDSALDDRRLSDQCWVVLNRIQRPGVRCDAVDLIAGSTPSGKGLHQPHRRTLKQNVAGKTLVHTSNLSSSHRYMNSSYCDIFELPTVESSDHNGNDTHVSFKTCKKHNRSKTIFHHTTTTILRPFFRDHPGEPVPEENFGLYSARED